MSESHPKLSSRSLAVLEMIAAGSTYEQILAAYPDMTYLDIFEAAEEALALAFHDAAADGPAYSVAQKRERYPRAYEKWTDPEDRQLRALIQAGATVAQIAGKLQRNRGAIRARIMKLNLVGELSPREQARLARNVEHLGE